MIHSFGCDLRDLCQGKSHMVRWSLRVLLVADIHRYHLIYDNYQMISYIYMYVYVYKYIVDVIYIYIYIMNRYPCDVHIFAAPVYSYAYIYIWLSAGFSALQLDLSTILGGLVPLALHMYNYRWAYHTMFVPVHINIPAISIWSNHFWQNKTVLMFILILNHIDNIPWYTHSLLKMCISSSTFSCLNHVKTLHDITHV